MEMKFTFIQGVDDLLGNLYARSLGFDSGLFVMDVNTGGWSRKFGGESLFTVSFEDKDTIVGVAMDNKGMYLYRAELATNTFTQLARAPQLTNSDYSWAQGEYDYDATSKTLYISGTHDLVTGAHKFVLGATPTGSFQENAIAQLPNLTHHRRRQTG